MSSADMLSLGGLWCHTETHNICVVTVTAICPTASGGSLRLSDGDESSNSPRFAPGRCTRRDIDIVEDKQSTDIYSVDEQIEFR